MRSRLLTAATLAMLAQLALPAALSAQTRGGRGRPSAPAVSTRRPPPSKNNPVVYNPVMFPGVRPGGHRLVPCRSSIFGLVLFDPYWWWDSGSSDVNAPIVPTSEMAPRPLGGVQLDVDPRRALVYVDGLFAGLVEYFSGYFQHLDATAGSHVIEMVAPGYEPLAIEVLVSPGRTTTYRGTLTRTPGRD